MKGRVVVFGGAGFLGSNVADELSEQGYSVRIFDIRKSPYLRKDQEMIEGDILDLESVTRATENTDYVYNFAGVADIAECAERPVDTIKYNVLGTANILEACHRTNVKRFLFGSTIYVYSNKGSIYRSSKQAAESVIEAFRDRYDLDYTILRYGSLYGPRAQEWNSIRMYLRQAIRERKIEYNGTGDEKREYIHARDAARLSVDALKDDFINKRVIVTGSQSMSSREFMTMIKEIIGELDIKFSDEGDTDHYTVTPYRYDPKLAERLIGNRFIDLGQGILEVIDELQVESS